MKNKKRLDYLLHSPKLAYNILLRGRYDFTYDLMPVHSESMPIAKRINLLKSGINLLYRRTQPWSWPLHMQIELTNYCNLKCQVCPTGGGMLNRKPTNLDPALFESLLDEVGPYLLTMSLWGWGEPLLHPRLADILRLIQNRGITTFLSTNGQNMDDTKVLKALIDYPPTYLIIALDGLTDETNTKYRAGAKLAAAIAGIKQLVQMKRDRGQKYPILHHRFIVMKHNEHELPQLQKFGNDNHFDMCTIRTLSIIDNPDETDHRELLPKSDKYKAYEYKNNKRNSRKDFICEKISTFPTIFADGTVVSCEQDYNARHSYGNLADSRSFAEIWWSRKSSTIRKTIRDDMNRFSFCRNCPFKDRPVTDCSVVNLELEKQ